VEILCTRYESRKLRLPETIPEMGAERDKGE
jgi:hypothetical protein